MLHIAKLHGPMILVDGTITAVDAENYFCDVTLDEGGELTECRLRAASIGNSSVDILPKEGSAVVLAKISEDDYLVLACDQIDEMKITAAGYIMKINEGGISIANGDDSLKSIMSDLIDQIQSIYAPKDVAAIAAIKVRVGQLLQ